MRRYISGMIPMRPLMLALGFCAAPMAGQGHPHIFIDTTLRAVVDADGTFKGVEVRWVYDDFYSLLIFADMGLDSDGDGALTPDEVAKLEGFDLQWVEGYEGDTYVIRAGAPVPLGPPQSRGLSVTGGRITTTHFRAADVPASGLVIKAYDPTFYTAYELVGQVEVDGPCTTSIEPADLDAAYSYVEELLYATPEAQAQDEFPEVGDRFADTVMLSCQL